MIDWPIEDDDPNWQADWERGIEIGMLIIFGLAVLMISAMGIAKLLAEPLTE
jgi:hypothetical protein